jgi:hypothetical protein
MSAELLRFPYKEEIMSRTMNYADDFEMLTLRHEYFKKIKDPKSVNIGPYRYLAVVTAKIMYDKCRANFEKVGFDISDIESIAIVYLMAYLGLYSLEINQPAKEKFINYFEEKNKTPPTKKDFDKAEKNNIINFLRQKLHHCSKVCERKSRNIVAARSKEYVFAYTSKSKPSHPSDITQDYKKHGYRKVGKTELVEAKKRAKQTRTQDLTDKDGFKIVVIKEYSENMVNFSHMQTNSSNHERQEFTNWEDFIQKNNLVGLYSEENPEYLIDPEQTMINKQNELTSSMEMQFFMELDDKSRKDMLKKFINSNKGNPRLSNELKVARSYLKN